MNNVIRFTGTTYADIPPDDVLEGAKNKLRMVVVVGWQENDELYVGYSSGEISENNLLLDVAKQELIGQIFDNDE